MRPWRVDPPDIGFNCSTSASGRICVQAFILSVIPETAWNALSPQSIVVSAQPSAKSGGIGAGVCPIPESPFSQSAIYLASIAPSGSRVLSEVNQHEHQPECLLNVPPALVQDRSFQWIKQFTVRIGTAVAHITGAYYLDKSYPMDAFNKLLQEDIPALCVPDSG